MSLNSNTVAGLRALLADPKGRNDQQIMDMVLRAATVWRSRILANSLAQIDGLTIQNGPFKGMKYVAAATEGALLPRLIGSYEDELHPYILAIAEEGIIDTVIDVGCAEGYYAVGLARLMPAVEVHAFDTDPAARDACRILAQDNGVALRVHVGELFAGEEFARFEPGKTLVFMDIEGGERMLLDPDAYPALKGFQIIVETHAPDITALILERFAPSHDIARIDQGPKTTPLPGWLRQQSHIDQLLGGWEWRQRPTPWLVMRPRPG